MDRFYRGFTAGVAGGVIMNIWSLTSFHVLNLTTMRFLDWSAVMLYGTLPKTLGEEFYALLLQLMWSGTLGILFAFLVREYFTSQGLLGKGLIFGIISGFIIYAIPVCFGIQHLEFIPIRTAVSNHIGGAFWGITTAYTLGWLDSRLGNERNNRYSSK